MESVPVLDIEVDPRAGRRASPAAYSPLAGVALLALAWPWTFGLPLALPLLFVGLGAWRRARRPRTRCASWRARPGSRTP